MRFVVRRKNGCVVVECRMREIRLYDRDTILEAILPEKPVEGDSMTFEIKKVEKK